ncbi:MAG: hypothetical protein HY301_11985 [Verrucomicrobia bacterium]|nr:hypothetical protein [Verrucomicrobiota bacterium]
MKTLHSSRAPARGGYALLMVMIFCVVAMIILAGAMQWTASSTSLNARNNQYYATLYAAEAATEKVLGRLSSDYLYYGEATVYNNLDTYRTLIPTTSEEASWVNYQFNNAAGTVDRTYVARTSTWQYVALDSQYKGMFGNAASYRILSNARCTNSTITNLTVGVQQDVQVAAIPIFQFAMFHSRIMDFTGSATLTVRGRVHSNFDIYAGSSANQTFYDDVTSVGIAGKVAYAGYALSSYTGTLQFNSGPFTNSTSLSLPIGTNNTADAVHDVLNPPPAAETTNFPMSSQRFYNLAQLLILVKDTGVVVAAKAPYSTTSNAIPYLTNLPIATVISTNKTFYDLREYKTVKVTEFNIGNFNAWAQTNAVFTGIPGLSNYLGTGNSTPNIVYIDDQRTVATNQLTAVRIVNGKSLSTNGLTVATPDPLYVQGHFNVPVDADIGTTNTANTRPSSLIADSLTVLSQNWAPNSSDTKGASTPPSARPASSTTINTAILAGEVYGGTNSASPGTSPYSAGMFNLPRLLESWSSQTLTINGSLVCMFNSTNATSAFRMPGDYYNAPTRAFTFDNNFKDSTKLPPGTPMLRTLIRGKWSVPPGGVTNYVAN